MHPIIAEILSTFQSKGNERYGSEQVTQLEHALQCGYLAHQEDSEPGLVVASLLHDIGHILSTDRLPENDEEDLHDFHEALGGKWLEQHFGPSVFQPVQLHVEAKRYLCTIDKSYQEKLSPASLKSFYDQGGEMSAAEIQEFETQPFFKQAIQLRKWDDQAKVPQAKTPDISFFIPFLEECLSGE